MYFLYFLWYILFEFLFIFKHNLNKYYIFYNKPYISNKRSFFNLPYFEKLFLILFYKHSQFYSIFSNVSHLNRINLIRKLNYPLINNFFWKKFNKNVNTDQLQILVRQFLFFKNKSLFSNQNVFFKNKFHNFIYFLILNDIFVKKYFYLIDFQVFNKNATTTLKLNFLFFIFFFNNYKLSLINFNLNNYNQWLQYCFSPKIKKLINIDFKKSKMQIIFKKIIFIKQILIIRKYKKIFKKFKFNFFFSFNPNQLKNSKIIFYKNWNVINFYKIRFLDTSVSQYVNLETISNYSIMYLRKNRVFNKSRYSRNRQLYRTGVYWCIWLNIVLVYGLYFIFYKFSFNFGYIWFGLFILLYSTILARVIKYNFYNIFYLIKEFNNLIRWCGFLFYNFITVLFSLFSYYIEVVNINFFFPKNIKIFINSKFIKYVYKKPNYTQFIKIVEFWHGLKEKDTSFLRHKTITHWIKLFLKVLTIR